MGSAEDRHVKSYLERFAKEIINEFKAYLELDVYDQHIEAFSEPGTCYYISVDVIITVNSLELEQLNRLLDCCKTSPHIRFGLISAENDKIRLSFDCAGAGGFCETTSRPDSVTKLLHVCILSKDHANGHKCICGKEWS